jgi:hypothetical protein
MMEFDALLKMVYCAGVNTGVPDFGNREEFESDIRDGTINIDEFAAFFNEFGRLYADARELDDILAKQADADAIFNEALRAAHGVSE